MQFLYNFFIHLYQYAFRLAAMFNVKAKKAIEGRQDWEEKLTAQIDPEQDWIWMHCSSLGEFEQGRPVFEALKKEFPNYRLALSFFSPSGYEIRKDYDLADLVFYLPFDTPKNAKKLATLLQPKYWILVKYDYWFNHLKAQHKIGTQVLVISAIFRPNQAYFKAYGQWMTHRLRKYLAHFFVQDEISQQLLQSVDINKVSISGDTRYDRVKQIAQETQALEWVAQFKENKNLIVVGSSWSDDEELWQKYLQTNALENWKTIIVPHEIYPANMQKLKASFQGKTILYSEINDATDLKTFDIIIVDAIGFLSKIYASAELAYVGGGFNKSGVHNTLEPAVFKVPVVIGPNYQKFNEVKVLKAQGVVYPIQDYSSFETTVNRLVSQDTLRSEIGKKAANIFDNQASPTKIIMDYLRKN